MRFPEDVPVLSDGVVTLRAHRPDDVPGVLEQCTDPASRRWTTVPVPYTRAHAETFVGETVPAGWQQGHWAFAVEAREGGVARFCGTVELRSKGNRRAELAYGAPPWARGQGITERALRLLLAWGFEERRLRAVVWWAGVGNWASRRTAWRLGFSCDGTVERWLPQRGDLVDGWVGVLHVDDERAPRTPWLDLARLEGGRVVLRDLVTADVPRVQEARGDPRTRRWLPDLPPSTHASATAYVESRIGQRAEGSGLTWAVADRADDRLVGVVSLLGLRAGRQAELSYWAHPDARGRGLTTEACRLVARHCLAPAERQGLGLRRLWADVTEGNDASVHVLSAVGFRPAGRARHAARTGDGSLADALLFDLLPEDPPGPRVPLEG